MTNNLSKNLYHVRKKAGLSQEEFAEKLFVSRQAVSKWERGEAYPDTENLILISSLFNVTLDELVHGDLSSKEDECDEDESEDKDDSKKFSVDLNSSGLHIKVRDDEDKEDVHVNMNASGLHINVCDQEDDDVSVNFSIPGLHINVNGEDKTDVKKEKHTPLWLSVWYALPYPIVVTVAFLLLGFSLNAWYWAWTLFITIPVYYTLIEAIREKRFADFAYPVLITFVYCLIGMLYGAWHPWWLLFVTIPIYYPIADAIDRCIKNAKKQ